MVDLAFGGWPVAARPIAVVSLEFGCESSQAGVEPVLLGEVDGDRVWGLDNAAESAGYQVGEGVGVVDGVAIEVGDVVEIG